MPFLPTHAAPRAALSVAGLEARTTPAALAVITVVAADTGEVFEVPVADPVFGDATPAPAAPADELVSTQTAPPAVGPAFLTLRAADTGQEQVITVADPVFGDAPAGEPSADQPLTSLADAPSPVDEPPVGRPVPWWRAGLNGGGATVGLTFGSDGSIAPVYNFDPIRIG